MLFGDYQDRARWITTVATPYYPDYLEEARATYGQYLVLFRELVTAASGSAELLRVIANLSEPGRVQVLRIFRKYVSPDTSVEMLKRKSDVEDIIRDFGCQFRSIGEVKERLAMRPDTDEVLLALLFEYKNRGQKGYDLTDSFFSWFDSKYGHQYIIHGPRRAGPDVMLDRVLPGYSQHTPADFVIYDKTPRPLVVGFARYDSDRGGAQEDDRTGGNRDKVMTILEYASSRGGRPRVLFINDGPGLLIGDMWNSYHELEKEAGGRVLVCTLKMLDSRVTEEWLAG